MALEFLRDLFDCLSMSPSFFFRLTPIALAVLGLPVTAQVAPDAGRVLQEQTAPTLTAPKSNAGVPIITQPNEPTLPGGATVELTSVHLIGNTLLSEANLSAGLGNVTGQSFDLAGLRGLAERISDIYHRAGYPFARAYLPPQDLSGGQLTIGIIEGKYGEIRTRGDARLAAAAERFLSPLRPGAPIESATLERVTLLLSDQPGIKVSPVILPGQAFGTGDLEVEVERKQRVSGTVGYDNYGSRFTGEHRLSANAQIDSPFTFGDQLLVKGMVSDEGLWLGNIGYILPVGSNGWRANVSYARTYYLLGKDFAASDASGTAEVYSAGAAYPVVRTQAVNLTANLSYQHKRLHDIQGAAGTESRKSSDSIPVNLQFDARDGFLAGGVTYGSVGVTAGRLTLSDVATDVTSGLNSRGSFNKWNLDIARLQSTWAANLSFFGRVSAQWASKNLDSSERIGLGGPAGVRAYPVGEGFGDSGWLAQVEMRYQAGAFAPYAFYDAGSVRINAKPESLATVPSTNERSVAGAGLGTRYQRGPWNLDLAVAWRVHGGTPEADNVLRDPRVWLTARYLF